MTHDLLLSRRGFLIGCSLAASPLLTPVTFAATAGENRLVVVVLRGAMDGLDVVRPLGDPAYLPLRPGLAADAATSHDLDGFFALHPAAAALMPLWSAGEMAFAHAVATPYRQGRSHFIGQDALENGTGGVDGQLTVGHDGWLNRALGAIPGADAQTGVSVGQQRLLILEGSQEVEHYFPVEESSLSLQGQTLLAEVNAADPLFAEPFARSQQLALDMMGQPLPKGGVDHAQLGTYVAQQLTGHSRIASLSLGGWDTHHSQPKTMAQQLTALGDMVLAIKSGLGRHWGTTLVLAMTEFGRTARENGTFGTDHGTGGLMIAAGGALKGQRVLTDWPGLGESDLLAERDLRPTRDVRAFAGWALRGLYGLDAATIETCGLSRHRPWQRPRSAAVSLPPMSAGIPAMLPFAIQILLWSSARQIMMSPCPDPERFPTTSSFAAILRLIAEEGEKAVAFSSVARATGLSAPSLVQRYGALPEMIQSALHGEWDRITDLTTQAIADMSASSKGPQALLKALSPAVSAAVLAASLRDAKLRDRARTWRQ